MHPSPAELLGGVGAAEIRRRLLASELTCRDLVDALLDAIAADETDAWVTVEPAGLMHRAAALDALDAEQRQALAMFGMPLAVKDNFDTAGLATAYGSPIYRGHRPAADAASVAACLRAGALLAGKVTCTEFATLGPTPTRNPIASDRTPGGSSSGSAAAVGAGTVPLATGTQTAGSINRPASYCGVLGYKPSAAVVDRAGVKLLSATLDTVGFFARTVEDLQVIAGANGVVVHEPDSRPAGRPGPRVGLLRTELWDAGVEPEARAAIDAWAERARSAGLDLVDLELDPGPGCDLGPDRSDYRRLVEAQATIQLNETARSLAPELAAHPDQISEALRDELERGARVGDDVHTAALATAADCGPRVMARLADCDAVLTPSATGVPPLGTATTGDPLFCRIWTLIGAPAVSLPLIWTHEGLPVGLQLVAARGSDARLLGTAGHLLHVAGPLSTA